MLSYPVMKTTSNSFRFNPQLPFTGFAIPRCASVMPFLHFQGVVQSAKNQVNRLGNTPNRKGIEIKYRLF